MRICFSRFGCAALLGGDHNQPFGGAEVRAYTFANTMAKGSSHQIHFVTGGPPYETRSFGDLQVHFRQLPDIYQSRSRSIWDTRCRDVDGFERCWKVPMLTAGRFAKSFKKRLLNSSFKKENITISTVISPCVDEQYREIEADVYCSFGVDNVSANIVATAASIGKKSIVFTTSDLDFSDCYYPNSTEMGPVGVQGHLCHYAISHADEVIVQTDYQRQELERRYGRTGVVIRNPIDISRINKSADSNHVPGRFAFWIGRDDPRFKRPHRCMDLARLCPDIPFLMVVNKATQHSYDELIRAAPDNVNILEQLSYASADQYIATATVLVNTSENEGFPNAFLQAAKHGTPILSYKVDPGGMLSKHGCGVATNSDLNEMAAELRKIWRNAGGPATGQFRGTEYVRRYHALHERVRDLENVIEAINVPPAKCPPKYPFRDKSSVASDVLAGGPQTAMG